MAEAHLDDLDLAILDHLQEDGRRTFTDIAQALDVSVGTIRNRFTRMREENILEITGTILNPKRVGFYSPAIIHVSVEPQYLESAVEEIAEFPEVANLAIVAGDYDLDVTVACRDNDHLLDFLNQRLHVVKGVQRTRTNMMLRIVKVTQADVRLLENHEEG